MWQFEKEQLTVQSLCRWRDVFSYSHKVEDSHVGCFASFVEDSTSRKAESIVLEFMLPVWEEDIVA